MSGPDAAVRADRGESTGGFGKAYVNDTTKPDNE
jgi:hypothetical protein